MVMQMVYLFQCESLMYYIVKLLQLFEGIHYLSILTKLGH